MTPSSDHQAHVAPAEPHPIKQTLWQRWMAWSGSFLILSIIVHFLLIGGGAVLVVQVVQGRKEKLKFTAPPPSPAGMVEHKVKASKKTAAAAPAVSKRIVSTAANASISLPAMEMNASSGPDVMASVMSGLGGSGLGAGAGAGGGAGLASMPPGGMTAFGFKGPKVNGLLTGYFYDLKLKADGKTPTEDMGFTEAESKGAGGHDNNKSPENQRYPEVVKQFVKSGWDPKVLQPYFKAPDPVSAYQIAFKVPSIEGPKAFNVEKTCKGMRWLVHYKGSFTASKDGQFRFVGCGDDVLVVRLKGKNYLDATNDARYAPDAKIKDAHISPMFTWNAGPWFTLNAGEKTEIEILIGEGPGGTSAFFLGVEDKSAPNPQDDFPIFQLQDGPIPDEKSMLLPKAFSGRKMVLGPTSQKKN